MTEVKTVGALIKALQKFPPRRSVTFTNTEILYHDGGGPMRETTISALRILESKEWGKPIRFRPGKKIKSRRY